MKHKNNILLMPCIIPLINSLDDLTPDEIDTAINLLDIDEKFKLRRYEQAIGDKINCKRLFIFICGLIDQREFKNLRTKNLTYVGNK